MLTHKKCNQLVINVFLYVLTAQKMYSIKHRHFIQLEAQIMHNTPRHWEYKENLSY